MYYNQLNITSLELVLLMHWSVALVIAGCRIFDDYLTIWIT